MPAARTAEWVDRMRRAGVADVAEALGLDPQPPRGSSGGSIPCPACGAERRHTRTRDKRAAAGIRPDGGGWHCFQCEGTGDALDLVALNRCGKRHRELSDSGKTEVREWCMRWLGLDPTKRGRMAPAPRRAPPRAPAKSTQPEPTYPPRAEVDAFLAELKRVDEVTEVAEWLRSKRIDPQAVADRGLARALPVDGPVPTWTRCRTAGGEFTNWARHGYRLIVPMVDASGIVRSVIARSVIARNVLGHEPKSRSAQGSRRGLVLACELARRVLVTGQRPDWWPADQPLRFEIAEGEKKWLMRAVTRGEFEAAPACIGIESGSWTDEIAARIPDGSTVFVATDPKGDQGAKYATTIVRVLESRVRSKAVRVELRPEFRLDAVKSGGQTVLTVRVKPTSSGERIQR